MNNSRWLRSFAVVSVGAGALVLTGGSIDAQKTKKKSPAALEMGECGCPSVIEGPACELRTSWSLDATTMTPAMVDPSMAPYAFDITVTEGPTRTMLAGTGQLNIVNMGTRTTHLSSVVVALERPHTGPGKGNAPGPGGKNWDLLRTALQTESALCDGVARTCYGELSRSAGDSLVLFDPQTNDVIALSGQLPLEPSRDNDGDGLRDEDPALPSDPSLITEGCSVIDNDRDGAYDEDPIDGIDNDGDGLIDEDDPDDDGDGLVDEDGTAEDAVVIHFAYEIDVTGLGLSPGDDLRIDLLATFDADAWRGGTCSIDVDCDGVAESSVRTLKQRLRFYLPAATPVCQTVTLDDAGAAANDPSCVSVTTSSVSETVSATGLAGTQTLRSITGTVSCGGGSCTTNVTTTATLTCPQGTLLSDSPASASFAVECTESPPGGTDPADFCTKTQMGWADAGPYLVDNFATVFPGGIVLGDPDGTDGDGSYALYLSSASAVSQYLPQDGAAAALTADQTDPHVTSSGALGGQLVAATLNVGFDAAGLRSFGNPVFPPGTLGTLLFEEGCVAEGLAGLSVNAVIDLANTAISGGGTPIGVSIADLSDALRVLNENYANCDTDLGCLDVLPLVIAVDAQLGNQLLQFTVPDVGFSTQLMVAYPMPSESGLILDVDVSPDGRIALVSDFLAQQIDVVDVLGMPTVIGTIPVPLNAEDVDISCAPGGYALVTDGASAVDNRIVSLDVPNLAVKHTLELPAPLNAQAIEIVADPSTSSGYTAIAVDYFNDLVVCVDIFADGTLAYCGALPSGASQPINVTAAPGGQMFLVTHYDKTVTQFTIDAAGNFSQVATYPGAVFSPTVGIAQSMVFAPDGSSVYWYDTSNGTVRKMSVGAGYALSDTGVVVPVGTGIAHFGVDQMAINRTGTKLVVNGSGYVWAVDLTTDTQMGGLQTSNFYGGGIAFQR